MGKEAEPAHPKVHADEDDALPGQCVALGVKRGLSAHIRAAENPNHDGQLPGRGGGAQDVEREASFGFRHFFRRLWAFRAEFRRIAHAAPMLRRLRLSPAQLADRRRRIGNTFEADDAVRRHAANLSAVDPDNRCLGKVVDCAAAAPSIAAAASRTAKKHLKFQCMRRSSQAIEFAEATDLAAATS